MSGVTGIGGIFFRAQDPERLYAWYEQHLGIRRGSDGSVTFQWKDDADGAGMTVWALFPQDTTYFDFPREAAGATDGPLARSGFMINYRVDDLDALVIRLGQEGVEVDPHRESMEYGSFAWLKDPEGNVIELWEPPAGQ